MPTAISTPLRISTTTPTTLYTAPAGGTTGITLVVAANANTSAGFIKIEVNKGSDRAFAYLPVRDVTSGGATPYWSGSIGLGGLTLASGNTIKITTPQAIDFDFWVVATEG